MCILFFHVPENNQNEAGLLFKICLLLDCLLAQKHHSDQY
jgi:hypothetical protein